MCLSKQNTNRGDKHGTKTHVKLLARALKCSVFLSCSRRFVFPRLFSNLKKPVRNILMAEGGDFGYDDPALDDGLDHDDDEQGVALGRARRPLPTMAVKQSKCKQGNTR